MRPARDRLTIPVAGAVTLMWLASGFTALVTQEPASLEVFVATTALEGAVVGYALNIRLRPGGEEP